MGRIKTGRTLLLSAAAVLLVLSACGKKPRVQPPAAVSSPAPVALLPSVLEEADRYFAEAKYAESARAYQKYLSTETTGAERDRALFRLGMSHALSEESQQSLRQAQSQLEALLMQHSHSPYAAEAKFILGLLQEIRTARADLRARDNRIRSLQGELDRAKKADSGVTRQVRDLQQELQKLGAEAREKDDRIKHLSDELDQLKKIDMQRRTPRSP